jgi:NAD(P)-dependent dehydrogenase (short-subunit alcohol dehydrogenase family)
VASEPYSLRHRVVFITGAARGIGAECARKCAAKGAKVALVGLEPEELERVAQELGPDAAWFEADVTDSESVEAAVEGTIERFGGIAFCIPNAGIAGVGPVRLLPGQAVERIVEVNLLGSMKTIRACLPHIVERKGYVLQIASLAAVAHSPGMSGYAASKAGVEAYANCLRAEVKHLGVGVGVGYFSWIDTDLVRGADDRKSYREMRSRLRGPMATTHPVSAVGEAVVEGIESKARWVVVPKWAAILLWLRPLLYRLTEAQGSRTMAEFEPFAAEDIAALGDRAGEPVGAGGAAAVDAARRRASA